MNKLTRNTDDTFNLIVDENELLLISALLNRVRLGGSNVYSEAAFTLMQGIEQDYAEFLDDSNRLVGLNIIVEDDDSVLLTMDGDIAIFELYDASPNEEYQDE